MPRGAKRSSGQRAGAMRTAYGQRSDLNTAGGKMPVEAGPSQGYGQRVAQENAQRAVPMGTPQVAPAAFAGRPASIPAPGSMGDLFADSEDPDEHVMSGAAIGPGPGPSAFGMDQDNMRREDLAALQEWLPMIADQVNRSGGSPYTRYWLRTVLGAGAGNLWE